MYLKYKHEDIIITLANMLGIEHWILSPLLLVKCKYEDALLLENMFYARI